MKTLSQYGNQCEWHCSGYWPYETRYNGYTVLSATGKLIVQERLRPVGLRLLSLLIFANLVIFWVGVSAVLTSMF